MTAENKSVNNPSIYHCWQKFWAISGEFQQNDICNLQRLRSACAYTVWSELLLVAWTFFLLLATLRKGNQASKNRVILVYTSQNANLTYKW